MEFLSLSVDMLVSAVSVLVVAQSSSEIPEGLMNNPVFIYRVAPSRLTRLKFQYSADAIACRGWREGERYRRGRHFMWSVAMERRNVQQRVTYVRSFGDIAWPARSPELTVLDIFLWGGGS